MAKTQLIATLLACLGLSSSLIADPAQATDSTPNSHQQTAPTDDWDDPWAADDINSGWQPWHGFVEAGAGMRLHNDPAIATDLTLGEIRGRLEKDYQNDWLTLRVKTDIRYDRVVRDWDLEWRELAAAFSPSKSIDVKAGRQVLSWGLGDLLFVNDLFPKDFQSFFSGRDQDYLKAPSDSIKISVYGERFTTDLVWTPIFEPDRFLNGERFAFFDPGSGMLSAPEPPFDPPQPARKWSNSELALRLQAQSGQTEYAFYAYHGFFKQPQPDYSALSTYGVSLSTPLAKGLFRTELAYYDSRDDRDGSNPQVPNSQLRTLLAYEQELAANISLSGQYYLEWTLNPDKYRQLFTLRMNYGNPQERIHASVFALYSPSDDDFYLRPTFNYRMDDFWAFTIGANLFGGSDDDTTFGQLETASNAYVRLRYSY